MPERDVASGLVCSSMELLAFACRQFALKFVDLSVRVNRILYTPEYICERA